MGDYCFASFGNSVSEFSDKNELLFHVYKPSSPGSFNFEIEVFKNGMKHYVGRVTLNNLKDEELLTPGLFHSVSVSNIELFKEFLDQFLILKACAAQRFEEKTKRDEIKSELNRLFDECTLQELIKVRDIVADFEIPF